LLGKILHLLLKDKKLKRGGKKIANKIAFIVTLIGGILSVIGGIFYALVNLVGTIFLSVFSIAKISLFSGIASIFINIILPLWIIIGGALVIWQSIRMRSDDSDRVKKAGIIALIFGILTFNLITIIGSIIALVKSKE